MLHHSRGLLSLLLFGSLLFLAACGGDDDGDSDSDGATDTGGGDATAAATTDGNSGGGGSSSGGGGSAGTLTLGDEVIQLDSARCFLQEQDVVGSPGKILLTGQGFGTLADGNEFVLDFTRFDEDSNFTGDDILVDVGDPRSDDSYGLRGSADLGTVQRDGDTLSASGLTFSNFDAGTEIQGAFELKC